MYQACFISSFNRVTTEETLPPGREVRDALVPTLLSTHPIGVRAGGVGFGVVHNTPNSCISLLQEDDIVYTHGNRGERASHPGVEEDSKGSAVRR